MPRKDFGLKSFPVRCSNNWESHLRQMAFVPFQIQQKGPLKVIKSFCPSYYSPHTSRAPSLFQQSSASCSASLVSTMDSSSRGTSPWCSSNVLCYVFFLFATFSVSVCPMKSGCRFVPWPHNTKAAGLNPTRSRRAPDSFSPTSSTVSLASPCGSWIFNNSELLRPSTVMMGKSDN